MFLQNFGSYENMRSHNGEDDNMNVHHLVNLKFFMPMPFLFLLYVQQNSTNVVGFLVPFCDFYFCCLPLTMVND